MSRPRKKAFTLAEKLQKIRQAGLPAPAPPVQVDDLDDLKTRIEKLLHLLQTAPKRPTTMTFLVLYDIENDKVRHQVARYLKQHGCIRIQKSVFMASQPHSRFQKIMNDLKEIQSFYENNDSIILVPINTEDARSMKVIGRDVQIETIIDKPNTLFF